MTTYGVSCSQAPSRQVGVLLRRSRRFGPRGTRKSLSPNPVVSSRRPVSPLLIYGHSIQLKTVSDQFHTVMFRDLFLQGFYFRVLELDYGS